MKVKQVAVPPLQVDRGPTKEIWSIQGNGVGTQVGFAYLATAAVASNAATAIPFDNTIPQNTEGDAFPALDITITPAFATSLLEVVFTFPLVSGSTFLDLTFALFRDSGVDAIAVASVTVDAVNYSREINIRAVVTAGSTAPTTFKMRWGRSTGTGYINRINSTAALFNGVLKATATVRETKQ